MSEQIINTDLQGIKLPEYSPPYSNFVTEMTIAILQILCIGLLSLLSTWFYILTLGVLIIMALRLHRSSLACKQYMKDYKEMYLEPVPLEQLQFVIDKKIQAGEIRPELFGTYLAKRRLAENSI